MNFYGKVKRILLCWTQQLVGDAYDDDYDDYDDDDDDNDNDDDDLAVSFQATTTDYDY